MTTAFVERDREVTPVPSSPTIIEGPFREVNRGSRGSRTRAVLGVAALVAAVGLAACTDKETRAERAYREAVSTAEREGLDRTIETFEAIARDYPGTRAAERAAKDAVLYRGLAGAVDRYPLHRARDLMVDAARRVERWRASHRRAPERLADAFGGSEPPLDPWSRPLRYTVSAGGRSYEIATYGEDGEPGGTEASADLVVRDGEFVGGGR